MVKIDTEGFDLKVISGASELLGRTEVFQIEACIYGEKSFSPSRRGESSTLSHPEAVLDGAWKNTLENVITTMSHAGYHVIDIPCLNRSPKYDVLWLCDLAFLRNDSSLLAGLDYE